MVVVDAAGCFFLNLLQLIHDFRLHLLSKYVCMGIAALLARLGGWGVRGVKGERGRGGEGGVGGR